MKVASALIDTLSWIDRALSFCYTVAARSKFSSWGPGSRLGRRAKLIGPEYIQVGRSVYIGEQTWLNVKNERGDGRPSLCIGDGTYIGRFSQINAWCSVNIGRDVLIGDRVFISDADHNFADPDIPIRLQGDSFVGAVTLCDGCWIGIGAVILPGVTIGRNAVVAANAVVTHDAPDCTVVGGIPAKVIKHIERTKTRAEENP